MNAVQPIREIETIRDIQDYLKLKSERNYVLFCTGIYSSLRITDILSLKVRDVRNKKYIYLREKKTNKENRIPINDELKKIFNQYVIGKKDYEYLFPSRRKNKSGIYASITRQQAHNIIKDIGREFKLESIACHTMRKTFGYHYYQKKKDIETLKTIFNHHNSGVTSRYIGLTQTMIDNAIKSFKY